MKTLEQLLKHKLEADLKSKFNEKMKIIVTNDISFYLASGIEPQGNEILVVIQTGNGIRSVSDNGGYITQSLAIYIYVPVNYLQDSLAILTNYAAEESVAYNIQELEDYKFYVNYNTPTTDGLMFDFGTYDYVTIILMGNVLYSKNDISVGAGIEYYIDELKITNIISDVSDCLPVSETIQIEGASLNRSLLTGVSNVINLVVLYDKNNNLHKQLKQLSYYVQSRVQVAKEFKIKDNETGFERIFERAIVSVKRESSLNGFTLLHITIQWNGV